MENETIKIIFLGDITGRLGRQSVTSYVNSTDADFIIANIENASHGFGLTKKNYETLKDSGINCFTSGNHIWDKKDIYEYIDETPNLLRPINYPEDTPGQGSCVFELKNQKIAVINALGRVFMPVIESPWLVLTKEIDRLINEGVNSIFIDFHAEATAEKICLARYLSDKYNTEKQSLIKGFCGTHTHVQTADEEIINGMAYITDVGFCGAKNSVIGMDYSTSLKRLATGLPERYEIADSELSQINGVEVVIDEKKAILIKRINMIMSNNEIKKEVNLDI